MAQTNKKLLKSKNHELNLNLEVKKTKNYFSSRLTLMMKLSLDATKLGSLNIANFFKSFRNIFVMDFAARALRAWWRCYKTFFSL
jgi:hypothetical protein